jgi:hypothetical protein
MAMVGLILMVINNNIVLSLPTTNWGLLIEGIFSPVLKNISYTFVIAIHSSFGVISNTFNCYNIPID